MLLGVNRVAHLQSQFYFFLSHPNALNPMTEYNDPATTVLALNEQSGQPKNYSALSKFSGIPISTLRDRDHGRISKKERAVDQQYSH